MKISYIEYGSDGSVTVRKDGQTIDLNDQCAAARLQGMRSVGIRHASEITGYFATEIVGSQSHVVHFVNGGVLKFAYRRNGALLHLSADKLASHTDANGQTLFFVPPAEDDICSAATGGRQSA